MIVRNTDNHPAIAVKDACLARSGVYYYSYEEMLARGYTPAVKKPRYAEFRPAEVLERVKDKFAFAAVTVEHTPDETRPENFRTQATGIIGENVRVEKLASGETGLFGKMAFYTKDGWDYYKAGNKETSADYRSVCVPDPTGKHDFILKDIISVNGVVLTARGRGGSDVRVQDSAANLLGGFNMAGKKGVLGFLGIGRARDDGFKLSGKVLDGAKAYQTLDAAGKEKLVGDIMGHVTDLSEGQHKELLIGAIRDSLNHPIEALLKKDEVARVIDGLYDAAVAADEKASKEALASAGVKTTDAVGKEESKVEKIEKKAGDDTDSDDKGGVAGGGDSGKNVPTKDSLSVDELIDKVSSRILDGVDLLIDKKVQEALGIKGGERGKSVKDSEKELHSQDGGLDDYTRAEGAFLLDSAFGQ